GGSGERVGAVQARVEPLRRVGRSDLRREHVTDLVVERLRVGLGVEVVMLPPPVRQRPGETLKARARAALAAEYRLALAVEHGLAVPAGLGHTRLSKILLRKDVGRHRPPAQIRRASWRDR